MELSLSQCSDISFSVRDEDSIFGPREPVWPKQKPSPGEQTAVEVGDKKMETTASVPECVQKVSESTKEDDGVSQREPRKRKCVCGVEPKRSRKYALSITLEQIDEMKAEVLRRFEEDTPRKRRELNKISAMRSRKLVQLKREEEAAKLKEVRSALVMSLSVEERLIQCIVDIVHKLKDCEGATERLEQEMSELGEIIDESAGNHEHMQKVLA
jgi:hypothetical protein